MYQLNMSQTTHLTGFWPLFAHLCLCPLFAHAYHERRLNGNCLYLNTNKITNKITNKKSTMFNYDYHIW
jgi:hypothetical protein